MPAVASVRMSQKYVRLFLLLLLTVVAAKRDRGDSTRDRSHEESYENQRKSEDGPTTTTSRNIVGDAVVEKFVETLMASERYLKMIETVERKLNHLDATFHEKSNSILKYVSETLRMVKASPTEMMEKVLTGMKADLDRLRQSVTTRLGDHPTMRDPILKIRRPRPYGGRRLPANDKIGEFYVIKPKGSSTQWSITVAIRSVSI